MDLLAKEYYDDIFLALILICVDTKERARGNMGVWRHGGMERLRQGSRTYFTTKNTRQERHFTTQQHLPLAEGIWVVGKK